MLALENAEEVLQVLDRYTKQKSKDIPPELEEYLNYVAKTGDTVYRWPTIQYLFREKLISVIKEFHDTTPSIDDLPQCPNVDQFNYESMKAALLERLELFHAAPFTIQRLCELLTDPKKHYSRLDKFMRALEKNILVVSTVDPGRKPASDGEENGDDLLNGDVLGDINNIKVEIKKAEANGGIHSLDNGTQKVETGSEAATESETPVVEASTSSTETETEKPLINGEATESIATEMEANGTEEVKEATAEPPIRVEAEAAAVPSIVIEEIQVDNAIPEPSTSTADEVTPLVEEPIDGDAAEAAAGGVESSIVKIVEEIESEKLADEAKPEIEEKIDDDQLQNVESGVAENSIDMVIVSDVEKVPTSEKHSRDETEDDDDENNTRDAKKIRLDATEEAAPVEATVTDQQQSTEVEAKPTGGEENAAEVAIDATDAVDGKAKEQSASTEVVAESNVTIDVVVESKKEDDEPIVAKPVVEAVEITKPVIAVETPPTETASEVAETILETKADLPATTAPLDDANVPEITAEKVTELIGKDIIPETAAEAIVVKKPIISDAPIVDVAAEAPAATNQESMTVEEPEAAIAAPAVADDNNEKMDAAPITADDQMEVDESNSVDPMDL